MSSQSAARKAWNEAMRATAGANALLHIPGLQTKPSKRRSDRHKKQERRARARKVQSVEENAEYREAVWADALEGVDPTATVDDEEEYDELEELESSGKNKRRRKATASRAKEGVLPKKYLPRTLASILVEEASREDGVAKEFLNAEARLPRAQQLPRRKFCPVTGMEGIYTEPKSNIPFANLRALEQIRERPPPWMTLGGSAAFLEARKSILDDEA
jgi:hypothetical protein